MQLQALQQQQLERLQAAYKAQLMTSYQQQVCWLCCLALTGLCQPRTAGRLCMLMQCLRADDVADKAATSSRCVDYRGLTGQQ